MRNNRNVRTGMNRTGFVKAVGAGAMGVAGAAMMGSGVASACGLEGQRTFKVGVMGIGPSLGGEPDYYEKVGEATYMASEYALRNIGHQSGGYRFEVIFADAGCGGGANAFDALLSLKSQGCDFIIGPNCSGSAREAVSIPDPFMEPVKYQQYLDVWENTCVITPTADAQYNIDLANGNRALFEGPFHYHVLGASAVNKSAVLGELVCQQGKQNVAVIYEINEDGTHIDFVDSIVAGIVAGYSEVGCSALNINQVPAKRSAITAAVSANTGKDALVFASNTDMSSEVTSALESTGYSVSNVYVSSEVGTVTGAQSASIVLDPVSTGNILGESWDKLIRKSGVQISAFNPFGSNVASLYVAQCFEAANILGELICKYGGDVHMVNKALTTGTYPQNRRSTGLFYGVTWDGVNVFPNFGGGIKAEAFSY